jgi:solute carrier family 35 protein C2
MIAAEFTLLRRSSVVTLSICGIFKEVITIIAGGSVFDDKLTPINITGLVVTIVSIAYYNYMKITKMRKEARKDIAVATTDLGTGSDVEDVFQPPIERQQPGILDRLGVTFGVSSSNKDGGRYQPVHSPIHSPIDPQFGRSGSIDGLAAKPALDPSRGRRSVRARVNGPGPSSMSGSYSSSGNASDTEVNGRLSRKDKGPRNPGRGILASDLSDTQRTDSLGVRERSTSRQRSSP